MQSPWWSGEFPVTQGWHPGPGAYEPGHTGIDIGMPEGTHIVTPASLGPVIVQDKENPGGFGHYVEETPVSNPNLHVVLGHLSAFGTGGGLTMPGTVVGVSGSTGWSTGPHLHFEEDVGGQPGTAHDVEPSALLSGMPAANTGTGPVGSVGFPNPVGAASTFALDKLRDALGIPDIGNLLYRAAFVLVGIVIILIGVKVLFAPTEAAIVSTASKAIV